MNKGELENILLQFSCKEENERDAQCAFKKFYREYSRYLYAVVRRIKQNYPSFYDDLVDIVVDETFIKIYNNPPLHFEIKVTDTDKDVNNKFKAYIATTAKHILFDLFKENYLKQEHILSIDDDEIDFDPPEVEVIEDAEKGVNHKILEEVLLTFHERDRSILLSLYQWHQDGKKPPKELTQWLVNTHKTTPENIRQIKSRCEKKIKDHFAIHTKLKPIKS